MLSVIVSSALGVLFSLIGLIVLGASHPKRHRKDKAHIKLSTAVRIMVAIAVLVPSIVFVSMGNLSALLVWGGLSVIAGWVVALIPARIL